MKAIHDPTNALGGGLAQIRAQYSLPEAFPNDVSAAADVAAQRVPNEHIDRTSMPFATLDPASSTDLDQAFSIEVAGPDILLHYAIADVGWFVRPGDALDREAWKRGTTQYLPDGKVSLYPKVLSEGAASLLPDGDRPAVVFTVRIAQDGGVKLDGVERALIRSRAKLAYETVRAEDLPAGFDELSRRITAAELQRGAARVDPPEQELTRLPDGGYALDFRPLLKAEQQNAAMSLAANMAVADVLYAHHTGLFRVMPEPDPRAVKRLRYCASVFGLEWAEGEPLGQFESKLDPANPRSAAMMLAIRRAGSGARYEPFTPGIDPWHSAMAARYAHATAPLRRLADRYVNEAALAVVNGKPVSEPVEQAFPALPPVMAKADALGGQIWRAAIDLAETVMLKNQIGENFTAIVTDLDERGARIQLADLPIVARVDAQGVEPGDSFPVRLEEADAIKRQLRFRRLA